MSLLCSRWLSACVYIYIWQLSSFRAPKLWFIDLTVTTVLAIFNTFCQILSQEHGQSMKMAAECELPGAHLALILQFEFNARELLLGIANNNHLLFSASVYLVQSLMH